MRSVFPKEVVMKGVVLVALLASCGSAYAGEAVERGAGAASCGKFVADHNQTNLGFGYTQWAQGWLSGMNLALKLDGHKLMPIPDADAMNQWLVNYCTAHPLNDYDIAVESLATEVLQTKPLVDDKDNK